MTALSFQKGGNPLHKIGIGNTAIIQKWLEERGILNYSPNDDLTIDINGSVILMKNGNFPSFIRFNKVCGSFFCKRCGLTALEGSPKEVGDIFDCSGNKLSSMKGGPEKVGSLVCVNNNLSSFEYFPIIEHGIVLV